MKLNSRKKFSRNLQKFILWNQMKSFFDWISENCWHFVTIHHQEKFLRINKSLIYNNKLYMQQNIENQLFYFQFV